MAAIAVDVSWRFTVAHREGRQEGDKIGIIHLLKRLVPRPETRSEQQVALSLDDLTRLADTLQAVWHRPPSSESSGSDRFRFFSPERPTS